MQTRVPASGSSLQVGSFLASRASCSRSTRSTLRPRLSSPRFCNSFSARSLSVSPHPHSSYTCSCGSVVEHCISSAKVVGSVPKKCIPWMYCKSLWIKASVKCINVNAWHSKELSLPNLPKWTMIVSKHQYIADAYPRLIFSIWLNWSQLTDSKTSLTTLLRIQVGLT